MTTKPENLFIGRVHDLLPIQKRAKSQAARELWHGVTLYAEKMNNPFHSGTADLWYSGRAGDLWVEYKFLARVPQRASVRPFELLSALQRDWLNGRHAEGRNVAVILGCPVGGVILRERLWERELSAPQFTALINSRPALAEFIAEQTLGQRSA